MRNSPDDFDDYSTPGSVIGMSVASISGLIVGLLFRGEILTTLIVVAAALVFAIAGWWARGLQP